MVRNSTYLLNRLLSLVNSVLWNFKEHEDLQSIHNFRMIESSLFI